jgi:hypothetical protein
MATPDAADPIDLDALVHQWGREFAIERELAGLSTDPEATWVSLAEAERRAGVSRSTLRAWYRTGQVASRLTPGPHGLQRLVPLEIVLDKASRSPRTGPKPAPPAPEEDAPMSTPEALLRLAELAKASATERAEAAEARAEAAEAALHRALERAAAAEAEVRLLRDRPSP